MAAGQGGQFIEFAVNGGDELAGVVLPGNEHGRSLAAPGSVARGQRLFDVLGKDVVFGNGEIRPGVQAKLAEFVHAAFFHQLVAVGRGSRIEPEPGKPGEQKNSSRHQEDAQ